jgi:hypothetical protein
MVKWFCFFRLDSGQGRCHGKVDGKAEYPLWPHAPGVVRIDWGPLAKRADLYATAVSILHECGQPYDMCVLWAQEFVKRWLVGERRSGWLLKSDDVAAWIADQTLAELARMSHRPERGEVEQN